MDLQTFENNLKQLETNVIIAKENERNIKNDILLLQNKIQTMENENITLDKVSGI